MDNAISAGNYPSEIWPKVVKYVETRDFIAWNGLVDRPLVIRKPVPYFLVIDIHGFSKLCQECADKDRKKQKKTEMKKVSMFLRAFFRSMSECININGGMCVKFIGDAILVVHEKRLPLIELGKDLLKLYHGNFKKKYPKTDVVVLITNPRECLRGFVGDSDYVDYSFWAPGLNYLFGMAKKVKEGHVYFVRRNGKARKCY